MKKSYAIILLTSLFFYQHASYADIKIKQCLANQDENIIFDMNDAEISENLIDNVLHNQPEKREKTVIKIFTNENANDRKYWLADFHFEDQTNQYFFYQVGKEEIIEIDQAQYDKLLPKIIACNVKKETPLYSENF